MIHPFRYSKVPVYAVLTVAIAVSVSVCTGIFTAEDSSGEKSGDCGNKLTWKFTESDHTLTIKGSGPMENYSKPVCTGNFRWWYWPWSYAPWENITGDINKVVLPDGLTSIGDFAFYHLENLKTITLPDSVKFIGNGAFYNCGSLSSVSMSKSLEAIGDQAFVDCRKLSSVTLPDSVQRIGEEAFSGCTSLTYLETSRSLTGIYDNAFEDCPIKTVDNYSVLNIKPGSYGMPKSVKIYSYRCGPDLTWSVSSDKHTLTVTGSGEMRDYLYTEAPWNYLCMDIESVVLPEGLTYVGTNAFGGLLPLRHILIPSTVGSIGDGAFSSCPVITVYNRSVIHVEPGDFGLSPTARVINGCPETIGVTFMNGGSVVSTVAEKVGMCYELPDGPEPEDGRQFLGWFDSRGTEIASYIIADPGDETVVFARWASV